jgi:hypothetical protein
MSRIYKKGMSEAVLWIVRIIILVIIVAVIHFIKVAALNNALQTYDTEFYIENTKLLYSPEKLAYQSLVTGRTQPGIIDMEKFTEDNLNRSSGRKIPLKLTLTGQDNKMIREIYQDKGMYELLEPLTFSKQYDILNKTHYVLIRDGDNILPGKLNIVMVVSR